VNRVIYPDSGARERERDEIEENVGDDRNQGGKVAFVECLSLGSAALQVLAALSRVLLSMWFRVRPPLGRRFSSQRNASENEFDDC
jgi:hypothetical protein